MPATRENPIEDPVARRREGDRMRKVVVGCAGWSIPARYRDLFADGDSVLARYASRFPIVEINSSFYRPHQHATYARWAGSVPRGFRFSVKVPRLISHELALRGCGPALDAFLEQASGLGARLGGYLLQLPPSHVLDLRAASVFLRMFRHRTDARLACEPRHASWFSPRASALLARYGVCRVNADPAVGPSSDQADEADAHVESIWPYWRLHGSPRMYYSDYPDTRLRQLATRLAALRGAGMPAWVVFDNTAHGFATANAARLQELLSR